MRLKLGAYMFWRVLHKHGRSGAEDLSEGGQEDVEVAAIVDVPELIDRLAKLSRDRQLHERAPEDTRAGGGQVRRELELVRRSSRSRLGLRRRTHLRLDV